MSGKAVSVLLVDVGDVLLDYFPQKFDEAVAKLSGLSQKQVDRVNEEIIRPLWWNLQTGRSLPYQFYLYYRDAVHGFLPIEQWSCWRRTFTYPLFRQIFGNTFVPKPRMIDLVLGLRSQVKQLIIVSNINPIHYEYAKELAPRIWREVSGAILSHEVGYVKPDPEIWKIALEWTEAKPEECLMIDDQEVNIKSAQQMGLRGHVFTEIEGLKTDLRKLGFDFGK